MRQAVHTTTGALVSGVGSSDLLLRLRRFGAAMLARVKAKREAAATRSALAGLSDAQRADIGADGTSAAPSGPVIEVDGAVMRRLMAMR